MPEWLNSSVREPQDLPLCAGAVHWRRLFAGRWPLLQILVALDDVVPLVTICCQFFLAVCDLHFLSNDMHCILEPLLLAVRGPHSPLRMSLSMKTNALVKSVEAKYSIHCYIVLLCCNCLSVKSKSVVPLLERKPYWISGQFSFMINNNYS